MDAGDGGYRTARRAARSTYSREDSTRARSSAHLAGRRDGGRRGPLHGIVIMPAVNRAGSIGRREYQLRRRHRSIRGSWTIAGLNEKLRIGAADLVARERSSTHSLAWGIPWTL